MRRHGAVRFEDWETEQMKDPEFRAAAEELDPSYQLARLRIMRGLTQEQLAEIVGTSQPSIARLESGRVESRLSFLRRVVEALGARLEIRIIPLEPKQKA
jgi:transcriptional regulator with XRE-family HTH domain